MRKDNRELTSDTEVPSHPGDVLETSRVASDGSLSAICSLLAPCSSLMLSVYCDRDPRWPARPLVRRWSERDGPDARQRARRSARQIASCSPQWNAISTPFPSLGPLLPPDVSQRTCGKEALARRFRPWTSLNRLAKINEILFARFAPLSASCYSRHDFPSSPRAFRPIPLGSWVNL